ncbi:putative LRR receptor-like serine/threonine-protein kinase [Drosera capensis]
MPALVGLVRIVGVMNLAGKRMRDFAWVLLLVCVLGVWSFSCDAFVNNDIWALTRFREAIFEDPYLVLLNWNGFDPDPCQWTGVFCSIDGSYVRKLNISRSSLKGFLAPELGLLTNLEELLLYGNNLMGTIPKSIFMLNSLKALDLGMNRLTGPIPAEIGNLSSIIKLNLHSNALTGTLLPQVENLENLQELRLDRNRLRGTIPGNSTPFNGSSYEMYASPGNTTGLCCLSQLIVADLSYNFFTGTVPKCIQYLPRSSFQGNCLQEMDLKRRSGSQCGTPLASIPKAKPPDKKAKNSVSKRTWVFALKIVTGIIGGLFFCVALFILLLRRKNKSSTIIPWRKSGSQKKRFEVYVDSELLKNVLKFSRQELEVACEDFSNIIGSSPDSVVYKGTLKDGSEIAVISFCIKQEHWTGYHELYFQREVADLARFNHENVGKLRGYCRESPPITRMLVLEYASNGTLSEHLHYGEGGQLSWARRMRIIVEIARGLKYLHELSPPFTISELNSSAVYLTETFSPKLVDFESWKTIHARSEKNSCSIASKGAICVLPNSMEERHLDMQGNVYVFGILLLEIVSGRPPFCKEQGHLVDWAQEYLEKPELMSKLVDQQLKYHEPGDLKVITEVVSLCINPNSTKRPSMQDLCSMLESCVNLSYSAELRSSSLAWAELALMA